MSGSALLGFAIPAYRRPALLDRALESLVTEARPINAPIYICDDACDQTNASVVNKWKEIYSGIVHEINESNLGIDRNIDRAIVRCPSRYVLVIGDDDVVMPGFGVSVVSIITEQAPSHIVCSYRQLSNDYRAISHALIPPYTKPLTLRRLLPEYGWALGFIGAHVFRRDRFAACDVDGFGTYFHHLIRLIRYVGPDEVLGFVEQPLIGNRAGDETTATWSGDRLNVVFGLERALVIGMQQSYSKDEIDRTVVAARRGSGYMQFNRLLYWAALAERSGGGERYWEALAKLTPDSLYSRLRSVPRVLYPPIRQLIPMVRRVKRYIRRLGMQNR